MNVSMWYIIAVVAFLFLISLLTKRTAESPENHRRIELTPSVSLANKPGFFLRVLIALAIFIIAVSLSILSDYEFGNVKAIVGKLSDNRLLSLGLYGISVTDFLSAVFLASVASLILGKIAKSRTVYLLAALVGVMISGWFWHPCLR
jgi:hypothetical protein